MLVLLVVSAEDLRERLESKEGLSWGVLDCSRSLVSVGERDGPLRLLANEGARIRNGLAGILGVFERELGKGMW